MITVELLCSTIIMAVSTILLSHTAVHREPNPPDSSARQPLATDHQYQHHLSSHPLRLPPLQPPAASHQPATPPQTTPTRRRGSRQVAGGRWLEVELYDWMQVASSWRQVARSRRQVAVGRWLEAGGWRLVAGGWCWYGWSGGYSVWRLATEPNRNSAIQAIHIPLNTAYVSVSTEPPYYNHGCFEHKKIKKLICSPLPIPLYRLLCHFILLIPRHLNLLLHMGVSENRGP